MVSQVRGSQTEVDVITALHRASAKGDLDTVQLLLSVGAQLVVLRVS